MTLRRRLVLPLDGVHALGLPDRFAPAFTPLAFRAGIQPLTMVPVYPPGFPLHIALASLLFGEPSGPYVVSPLAAAVLIVLVYLLGRELGLSRPFAVAGAAILAACPVLIFQSVQVMSDVVASLWAVAAVLFALRGRRRDAWALAAGAALGLAVLVRPANVLVALPVGLALPWRRRALGFAMVGGLPFAVFSAAWSDLAYGGYLRTGYSGVVERELALAFFGPRFRHYAYWICMQLSPLVPIGWVTVSADRRVPAPDRALLLLWFASFFVFYCFWKSYELWWYTRFLLPALPAAIVAFLLVVQNALDRWHTRGPGLVGIAVVILAVVGVAEWRANVLVRPLRTNGRSFAEGCAAVTATVPDGHAIVLSMEFSGALLYHTRSTPVRWDALSPEDFTLVQAGAAENHRRVLALLLDGEVAAARAHLPGHWIRLRRVHDAALWELDSDAECNPVCSPFVAPSPET